MDVVLACCDLRSGVAHICETDREFGFGFYEALKVISADEYTLIFKMAFGYVYITDIEDFSLVLQMGLWIDEVQLCL